MMNWPNFLHGKKNKNMESFKHAFQQIQKHKPTRNIPEQNVQFVNLRILMGLPEKANEQNTILIHLNTGPG